MTEHIPEAVFWCLSAGLLAVLVLLARQRNVTGNLRRQVLSLEGAVRARDAEAHHLNAVRLPALADVLRHKPATVPGPLDGRLADTGFGHSLEGVVQQFSEAMRTAQARADQSAQGALKGAMRALQSLANEQQVTISEMQERHDDPEVLRDLLQIDHTNSQFGRRAQAIAVLCGSWPGRQRAASSLSDVVRGATSRIRDYRRVVVHGHTDAAVVSQAVEPVVLAVAELLDNAARHSEPNTTVEVQVQPTHNGTAIVIDDAGVGMNDEEIRQATAVLSGARAVDVTRLGDPPQFGLPVAGVLAARYGFRVSVDTQSPYGGVRAVVFLPTNLLTRIGDDAAVPERTRPAAAMPPAAPAPAPGPAAGRHRAAPAPAPAPAQAPAPAPAQAPAPAPAAGTAPPAGHPERPSTTAGGLPKRRRRAAAPAAASPAQPAQPAPDAVPARRPAENTASVMGAWQRGTRSGRSGTASADEGNQA